MTTRKADVVVVGAGAGGLSVAALLARAGREVVVLERAPFIGGRGRVEEKDGFILDYGIHVSRFHKKGKLAQVMRKLGASPEFIIPGEPIVFKNGKCHTFPRGLSGFIKTDLMTPKSKLRFARFMLLLGADGAGFHEDKALADIVRGQYTDEGTIEMMTLFSSSAISVPYLDVASAKEARKFFESLAASPIEPVGYLKGGWKTFLDLARKTIEVEGEIITRKKVDKVAVKNGKVEAVFTGDEKFTADAFVCAVPFQSVLEIIDEKDLGPRLSDYARSVEPTSGIIIDFALSRRVSENSGIIVSPEPLSMGCLISNVDPSLAPPGKQLGTWFQFIRADKIGDRAYVRRQFESLTEQIGRIFPGVWDVCEWKRMLSAPLIDGVMLKVGQAWTERPRIEAPLVSNLFFAGDTTCGIGAGGDIAFDSALRAAGLIEKHLKRVRK
jgi:15-cis-phytoene desaturase